MNEASKTKASWSTYELSFINGYGIDIGCGNDPIKENVKKFDIEQGDANEITKYVHEQFDYVFAAHCLEHMHDPVFSLKQWWQLVKPGGYLIFIVPDEDLYEQGYYPSIFNSDHKTTFTINKTKSWSPVSYNVIDLVKKLENGELLDVKLYDVKLNRKMINQAIYPRSIARLLYRIHSFIIRGFKRIGLKINLDLFAIVLRYPIDQTLGEAMAQIQAIVKKNK